MTELLHSADGKLLVQQPQKPQKHSLAQMLKSEETLQSFNHRPLSAPVKCKVVGVEAKVSKDAENAVTAKFYRSSKDNTNPAQVTVKPSQQKPLPKPKSPQKSIQKTVSDSKLKKPVSKPQVLKKREPKQPQKPQRLQEPQEPPKPQEPQSTSPTKEKKHKIQHILKETKSLIKQKKLQAEEEKNTQKQKEEKQKSTLNQIQEEAKNHLKAVKKKPFKPSLAWGADEQRHKQSESLIEDIKSQQAKKRKEREKARSQSRQRIGLQAFLDLNPELIDQIKSKRKQTQEPPKAPRQPNPELQNYIQQQRKKRAQSLKQQKLQEQEKQAKRLEALKKLQKPAEPVSNQPLNNPKRTRKARKIVSKLREAARKFKHEESTEKNIVDLVKFEDENLDASIREEEFSNIKSEEEPAKNTQNYEFNAEDILEYSSLKPSSPKQPVQNRNPENTEPPETFNESPEESIEEDLPVKDTNSIPGNSHQPPSFHEYIVHPDADKSYDYSKPPEFLSRDSTSKPIEIQKPQNLRKQIATAKLDSKPIEDDLDFYVPENNSFEKLPGVVKLDECDLYAQHKAATKIQKCFRGHMVRKERIRLQLGVPTKAQENSDIHSILMKYYPEAYVSEDFQASSIPYSISVNSYTQSIAVNTEVQSSQEPRKPQEPQEPSKLFMPKPEPDEFSIVKILCQEKIEAYPQESIEEYSEDFDSEENPEEASSNQYIKSFKNSDSLIPEEISGKFSKSLHESSKAVSFKHSDEIESYYEDDFESASAQSLKRSNSEISEHIESSRRSLVRSASEISEDIQSPYKKSLGHSASEISEDIEQSSRRNNRSLSEISEDIQQSARNHSVSEISEESNIKSSRKLEYPSKESEVYESDFESERVSQKDSQPYTAEELQNQLNSQIDAFEKARQRESKIDSMIQEQQKMIEEKRQTQTELRFQSQEAYLKEIQRLREEDNRKFEQMTFQLINAQRESMAELTQLLRGVLSQGVPVFQPSEYVPPQRVPQVPQASQVPQVPQVTQIPQVPQVPQKTPQQTPQKYEESINTDYSEDFEIAESIELQGSRSSEIKTSLKDPKKSSEDLRSSISEEIESSSLHEDSKIKTIEDYSEDFHSVSKPSIKESIENYSEDFESNEYSSKFESQTIQSAVEEIQESQQESESPSEYEEDFESISEESAEKILNPETPENKQPVVDESIEESPEQTESEIEQEPESSRTEEEKINVEDLTESLFGELIRDSLSIIPEHPCVSQLVEEIFSSVLADSLSIISQRSFQDLLSKARTGTRTPLEVLNLVRGQDFADILPQELKQDPLSFDCVNQALNLAMLQNVENFPFNPELNEPQILKCASKYLEDWEVSKLNQLGNPDKEQLNEEVVTKEVQNEEPHWVNYNLEQAKIQLELETSLFDTLIQETLSVLQTM